MYNSCTVFKGTIAVDHKAVGSPEILVCIGTFHLETENLSFYVCVCIPFPLRAWLCPPQGTLRGRAPNADLGR